MTLKLRHIALILLVTSASFLVGGGWHWFVGDDYISKLILSATDPYNRVEIGYRLFLFAGPVFGLAGLIGSVVFCLLPLVKDANVRGPLKLSLFGLSSILFGCLLLNLVGLVVAHISFRSSFGLTLCCAFAVLQTLSVVMALAGAGVAAIGLNWSVAEVIASRQKYARLPWVP